MNEIWVFTSIDYNLLADDNRAVRQFLPTAWYPTRESAFQALRDDLEKIWVDAGNPIEDFPAPIMFPSQLDPEALEGDWNEQMQLILWSLDEGR